mgnify:CR=1 FL=1
MISTIPEKIHVEIKRLCEAAYEQSGLTGQQRDIVQNLMYRAANAVLVEQARRREAVAKSVVTGRGVPYPFDNQEPGI